MRLFNSIIDIMKSLGIWVRLLCVGWWFISLDGNMLWVADFNPTTHSCPLMLSYKGHTILSQASELMKRYSLGSVWLAQERTSYNKPKIEN